MHKQDQQQRVKIQVIAPQKSLQAHSGNFSFVPSDGHLVRVELGLEGAHCRLESRNNHGVRSFRDNRINLFIIVLMTGNVFSAAMPATNSAGRSSTV